MYTIRVSDGVDKVIAKWKKSNPNVFKKYKKIYKELLEHPKTGLGHPEALRGGGDITCLLYTSQRIVLRILEACQAELKGVKLKDYAGTKRKFEHGLWDVDCLLYTSRCV